MKLLIFFTCLLFIDLDPSFAQINTPPQHNRLNNWTQFRCDDPNSSRFILVKKNKEEKIQVETETTRVFLKNIECQHNFYLFPLFRCNSHHQESIVFYNEIKKVVGFSKENYANWTEKEVLLFHTIYSYTNEKGQYVTEENQSEFNLTHCKFN